MAYLIQVILTLAVHSIVVHGGTLKRIDRDARLPEHEEEHIVPEEDIHEVFILHKPNAPNIGGDIGEPPPFFRSTSEENKSEEDSSEEEERFEKALLEQLSKVQSVELMKRAESIDNVRVRDMNGIRNYEQEVLPNTPRPVLPEVRPARRRPARPPRINRRPNDVTTMRAPVPVDGRLPNGLFTDINRVEPINEYLISRGMPPATSRPIPAPKLEIQNGELREEMPIPVEDVNEEMPIKDERPDLIRSLLDRVRPGGNNSLGNRRWAVYLGHVLLHALNTLIDGTQVALKEYSGISN